MLTKLKRYSTSRWEDSWRGWHILL